MGCKIIGSMGYVKSQVYKMDVLVDLAYISMVSGLPMLMIGNPGTGKSHVSKIVAKMFGKRDEDWFYQSITAKTSPEKLFGGLIAEKMLQGIEEYNLAIGAGTKSGVIFDELYKSQHPAMMNALLNFYDEEPTIFSGGKNISPDWQWAFNTTNFEDLPEDLRYCPLWDRQGAKFLVRDMSEADSEQTLMMCMALSQNKNTSTPVLTVADLELARKAAAAITVDQSVISTFYKKVLPILKKYCYISQRKINSLFIGKPGNPSILQSAAYVADLGEVTEDLLGLTPYFCWQDVNVYDKLCSEIQVVVIPPGVTAYKQIKTNIEQFISQVESGHWGSYEAAQQAHLALSESTKLAVTGIASNEKKKVPMSLRKDCTDLMKIAGCKVEELAAKNVQNVEF